MNEDLEFGFFTNYSFGKKDDREEDYPTKKDINLSHRERQLLRYLLCKFLSEEIPKFPTIFDTDVEKVGIIVNRTLDILYKISISESKFKSDLLHNIDDEDDSCNESNEDTVDDTVYEL